LPIFINIPCLFLYSPSFTITYLAIFIILAIFKSRSRNINKFFTLQLSPRLVNWHRGGNFSTNLPVKISSFTFNSINTENREDLWLEGYKVV